MWHKLNNLLIGWIQKIFGKWVFKSHLFDHDKKIFESSNQILSEKFLIERLDTLSATRTYRDKLLSAVENYVRFFEEVGNQYLYKDLKIQSEKCVSSLREFLEFVPINFFILNNQTTSPDVEWIFIMHPEAKHAGGEREAFYDKCAVQLDAIIGRVFTNYKEYRKLIANRLFL